MKEITVTDGQQKLSMTQIVLGSSDYLKLDNMPKVNHMFDLYVELGGNTFDTARHYRDAESVIGDWMSRHDRKAFNIITKCCHPKRGALDVPRVSPENMRADLTESLQHLQTEYVDVLLLHRDDPTKPVGPLMEPSALWSTKVRFGSLAYRIGHYPGFRRRLVTAGSTVCTHCRSTARTFLWLVSTSHDGTTALPQTMR